MELAAIGTLVGITKSVIDIVKSVSPTFRDRSAQEKLHDGFAELYGRIDILSVQLEQSENLTRMVPAWIELADRIGRSFYRRPSEMNASEVQILDRDLRDLMNESIRDHFSSTFFSVQFDRLPEVPLKLDLFRDRLKTLDRTISNVPPGDVDALNALWPQIRTHFNDARNAASDIERLAEDVHGKLIRELRDAAKLGLGELAAT
jgi:hypothetical protein